MTAVFDQVRGWVNVRGGKEELLLAITISHLEFAGRRVDAERALHH